MIQGIQWNPMLDALPYSAIRLMFNTASTMKDVLHLSIGQPDFPAPPHVVEANVKALLDGRTRYEFDAGLPALRESIARFYGQRYDVPLQPENVLITTGCCQAMFMALSAAVRPGMEVIVVEPVFVLVHIVEMAGGIPRRVVTTAREGYQVDPQAVIDAMNDKTCAVMLNSPGNPTGAVYPRETIKAICDAAAERGIAVISDEVYDRLVMDGEYTSGMQCSSLDNMIVCSSVSKTYSLAGLRLGWAISSEENILALQRYHMYISTTENTPTQYAVLAAFEGDQQFVEQMVCEYRRRRDRIADLVKQSPYMVGYKPAGAFFTMPSLPEGTDGLDIALRMLREVGVCTIPGGAFGESCNNALRMSFATSMQTIDEAFERINPWLEKQFS